MQMRHGTVIFGKAAARKYSIELLTLQASSVRRRRIVYQHQEANQPQLPTYNLRLR